MPMQINGKHISWTHLKLLYDAKMSLAERSQGLYLLKKLSKDHVHLTSYSRMRVSLAAEVNLLYTGIMFTGTINYIGAKYNSG